MEKRKRGQSLVEMAFVGPILIFLLFGIMDISYYIFAYSSLAQAVRTGADEAARHPPYQSWLNNPPTSGGMSIESDDCVSTIYMTVEATAGFIDANMRDFVDITYPTDPTPTDNNSERRNLDERGPIEVSIDYELQPLTPVFNLFGVGDGGTLNIQVTARRSIEQLGLVAGSGNGDSCAKDLADWQAKHPNP